MPKAVKVVNQKIHHVVDKDPINDGCYAIILEMVDVIYGSKKPFRYPLMVGIADKTIAQRVARKMSTTYIECLNILHGFGGLVPCETCRELFLPNSMTLLNGKNYCPICSKEATLKYNLKKVKDNLLASGIDSAEADRRIALVVGSLAPGRGVDVHSTI